MAEVKFEANKISLDDGETWTDIKPSKYGNWLQESIHAIGGRGNPINILGSRQAITMKT